MSNPRSRRPRATPRLAPLGLAALVLSAACNRTDEKERSASGEPLRAETGEASAARSPGGLERRYDIERGTIEFAIDGMEVGRETMRFKNYGLLEAKHKETKMQMPAGLNLPASALPGVQKVVSIIDGTSIVNYDPEKKQGTKTLNSLELFGGAERFEGKNMAEVGQQMYQAMGGVKTGTRTVAGQTCEVWKIEKLSTESCIHRGITLEVTTELMGMKQHSVATKIDWNAPVEDSWFVVPKDVTLRETDLAKQKLPAGLASALPSTGLPGKSGRTISPEEALRILRESGKE